MFKHNSETFGDVNAQKRCPSGWHDASNYPDSKGRIWKVSKESMFLFSQYLICSNSLLLPGNSSCNEGTLKLCTLWRWDSIRDWIMGCRQSFWQGVLTLTALLEGGANRHAEDEVACHTVVLLATQRAKQICWKSTQCEIAMPFSMPTHVHH